MVFEVFTSGAGFYLIFILAIFSLFCIGFVLAYFMFNRRKKEISFVNLRDKLKEISIHLTEADKSVLEIDEVLREVSKNAQR